MATQLFTNNAASVLASSLTAIATSLSVTAGHGARFPTITGSDYFLATLCQMSLTGEVNFEVVKVTARSTDTFTIVRAQEGTTALAYNAGDKVELRLTKVTMEGLRDFLQVGTGAVTRTVRSKGQDFVSVTDFGAVGNGVADDTAAIQAAVDALISNGGGTLYVPKGTYKTTSEILITADKIRIVGAGRESTVINPATNSNCFNFQQIGGKGWGVEDLSIKYLADGTAGTAIYALDASSGEISNLYVERCFNGIQLGNSQATRVQHIEMWYFLKYAIYINDNCNDVYLADTFLNGAAYGTSTPNTNSVGLYLYRKAHATMASRLEIIQCSRPLQAEGSSASDLLKPAFCMFTDCFFDSSAFDVRLNYTRTLRFNACWFSQRSTGCTIQNAIDTTFVGCSFVNNNQHGCLLQAGAEHTSFVGCTFDSNSQESSGAYSGLVVAANVSDFKVIGGVFANLGTFPQFQANGISILSGASNRFTIKDATFLSNTVSPVSDLSSGTERYIQGNIGYRTSNSGQATIASGTTTIVVTHGLAVTPSISDILLTRGGGNAGSTDLYANTITSTQFTINTAAAPSSNMPVTWQVRSKGA